MLVVRYLGQIRFDLRQIAYYFIWQSTLAEISPSIIHPIMAQCVFVYPSPPTGATNHTDPIRRNGHERAVIGQLRNK